MTIHILKGKYKIYKGDKAAEKKFRSTLSKILIDKFGKGPFTQNKIRDILSISLEFYISEFTKICIEETSVRFYQDIFIMHEDATEMVYYHLEDDEELSHNIDWTYIAGYRRILKFIIETGCDVNMTNGEIKNQEYFDRVTPKIDDLFFLGEMILTCVGLFAEQSMIDDLAEVTFDENDQYQFSRRHHYEFIFEDITTNLAGQLAKAIVDNSGYGGLSDLKDAIKNCFGINYNEVVTLIDLIHRQNESKGGPLVGNEWKVLTLNLNHLAGVPLDMAEQFFKGLTLDKTNKMTLLDLACKPYRLERYIYKPIIIWNIDGNDYAFFGKNAWAETFNQLSSNAIPWGKAPQQWLENKCFKKYVHKKEDAHDKWLDDEVEKILKKNNLLYDRNVKRLFYDNHSVNIDIEGLGEIDFIIISPTAKKIFITDCKHLVGRYDSANQKNDFNAFSKGSKNSKSYNDTMTRKVKWFEENKIILLKHFIKKYPHTDMDLSAFKIEGIFIVNTPTLYMYNAEYRIYTVDQVEEVINNTFVDKIFTIFESNQYYDKLLKINYPYFQKPEFLKADPFDTEY